jgi:hypothetical protein
MTQTKEKIEAAIRTLRSEGHVVEIQLDRGKTWFEIDRRMRASAEEMQNLADGVYSLVNWKRSFSRDALKAHLQTNSPKP